MRVLTYNIQSGLGIDGIRDPNRAAQVVLQTGADVAGLQEVEMGSPRSGFQNQPRRLAEATGFYSAYGHGFQRGPWRFGNCVLSRYPILTSRRHGLPGRGEPRSVLAAEIDWRPEGATDGVLHFLCTHLGLNGQERVEQVQEIKRILKALEGSAILVGDFNESPDASSIQELLNGSGLQDISIGGPTYPAPVPTARIDYIFARGLASVGASQVIESSFSDHFPVLGAVQD